MHYHHAFTTKLLCLIPIVGVDTPPPNLVGGVLDSILLGVSCSSLSGKLCLSSTQRRVPHSSRSSPVTALEYACSDSHQDIESLPMETNAHLRFGRPTSFVCQRQQSHHGHIRAQDPRSQGSGLKMVTIPEVQLVWFQPSAFWAHRQDYPPAAGIRKLEMAKAAGW
jgi:hypothetical protein